MANAVSFVSLRVFELKLAIILELLYECGYHFDVKSHKLASRPTSKLQRHISLLLQNQNPKHDCDSVNNTAECVRCLN